MCGPVGLLRLLELRLGLVGALPSHGRRVSGVMDLLLETPKGWVLVDHKSYQGRRDQWAAKTLTFSGQLALYAHALRASGMTVAEVWAQFPVAGGWVKLEGI